MRGFQKMVQGIKTVTSSQDLMLHNIFLQHAKEGV